MFFWNESLNTFAANWLETLIRVCWQGGLALALAWAVCRLIPRLPAWGRCWLWRVAYLKLLFAFFWLPTLDLPLLPPASSPEAITQVQGFAQTEYGVSVSTSATLWAEPLPTPAPSPVVPTVAGWLLLLWTGSLLWQSGQAIRQGLTVRRLRRTGTPLDGGPLDFWNVALSRDLNLPGAPRLMSSTATSTPLLIGILRPCIVLPESLLATCTPDELRLILAHELAHVQRRDLLWGWLPLLTRLVCGFHPLVGIAEREISMTQEIACDETALHLTGAASITYGSLLVRVATRFASRPSRGFGMIGMTESYHTLKRRLSAMKSFPSTPRSYRVAVRFSLLTLGLAALIPWRVAAQQATPPVIPPPPAPAVPVNPTLPPMPGAPATTPPAPTAPRPLAPTPTPTVPGTPSALPPLPVSPVPTKPSREAPSADPTAPVIPALPAPNQAPETPISLPPTPTPGAPTVPPEPAPPASSGRRSARVVRRSADAATQATPGTATVIVSLPNDPTAASTITLSRDASAARTLTIRRDGSEARTVIIPRDATATRSVTLSPNGSTMRRVTVSGDGSDARSVTIFRNGFSTATRIGLQNSSQESRVVVTGGKVLVNRVIIPQETQGTEAPAAENGYPMAAPGMVSSPRPAPTATPSATTSRRGARRQGRSSRNSATPAANAVSGLIAPAANSTATASPRVSPAPPLATPDPFTRQPRSGRRSTNDPLAPATTPRPGVAPAADPFSRQSPAPGADPTVRPANPIGIPGVPAANPTEAPKTTPVDPTPKPTK